MNAFYYQNQIIYTYNGIDVELDEAIKLTKMGKKVSREIFHENGDVTSLGYIKL